METPSTAGFGPPTSFTPLPPSCYSLQIFFLLDRLRKRKRRRRRAIGSLARARCIGDRSVSRTWAGVCECCSLQWLPCDLVCFMTRQLLTKYPGTVVWGTARNPDASPGLQALKKRHPVRLEVGTLDVTKEYTVEELAGDIEAKYGRLDLIVNCAGILHIPDVLQPEATISKVEAKGLMLAFEVNAIGPTIVAKHMWELLKIGQGHGTGRAAAVIANISAKCSSMKDNTLAGWYGYRASKTALNQMTKNMAIEAIRKKDPIICVLLHPGTVNTNLSKPFSANVPHMKLFSTDYAVERLLGIINKVRPEDNGKFTSWDRQEVPF